jgi:hypothetical protein
MRKNRMSVSRKIILVVAALLSGIASVAYACPGGYPGLRYSVCRDISLIGTPGILVAAAVSIAALGSHGGGPLGMLLLVATPVNFFLYAGLGLAAQSVGKFFRRENDH